VPKWWVGRVKTQVHLVRTAYTSSDATQHQHEGFWARTLSTDQWATTRRAPNTSALWFHQGRPMCSSCRARTRQHQHTSSTRLERAWTCGCPRESLANDRSATVNANASVVDHRTNGGVGGTGVGITTMTTACSLCSSSALLALLALLALSLSLSLCDGPGQSG